MASSAAESAPGSAKKLRENTSNARCRAAAGKVDVAQEAVGVQVVEALVDIGHRDRGQRCGGACIEANQVTQPERRAAQRERERVQRRGLRKAAEGVASALPVDQWVVLDGGEHAQVGIDAAQHVPQVVVLAEERVEAAVHRQVGAVVGLLGPAADTTAEVGLPLDDVDADTAFDQPGRRGKARDAAADHDDARRARQRVGVRKAGRSRMAGATRICHRGASARKVCTMLRCQPGTVSLRALTKPLARNRFRNSSAPSNSLTLRLR